MSKKTLTAIAVDKIKPPPRGRREYFDAALPGFALRVTNKGHKSWVVFYRTGGRLRRHTLGSYPALSLAAARESARSTLQEVAKGRDPAAEKAFRRSAPTAETFASVAAEFIDRYAKAKNRSWRETARIIERELLPRWGDRPIAEITRQDVIAVLDRVMDRNAPYMANRLMSVIRKLFNWAIERAMVDASPVGRLKPPGKEFDRDRVLGDDEIRALWAAWSKMGYPFGPLFKMLLVTGQRREEVSTMRWENVDPEAGVWTLPREFTKADRRHEVALSPLAVEVLDGLPRLGDIVFTTSGSRSVSGFSRAKRRADEISGVKGWRLHDLPRTAGTNMAKLGVPVFTISRVMNHAEGGVTKIYARHSYGDEKRDALELWADRLTEIIGASEDHDCSALH